MANLSTRGHIHPTRGGLLAKNTIWNLVGSCTPMIVAVFAIPILIHGLGKERFGILALAWALVGYASLFDMGLGRAVTQLVSAKLGASKQDEVPEIVWTSMVLMAALGVIGSLAIGTISPWVVYRGLRIPVAMQRETIVAFYLLAAAVPAVIVTAGLRGVLEAHQRFDLVAYLRIPTGMLTFIGPLLVLPFSRNLVPIVGILVAFKYVGCLAFLLVCVNRVANVGRRVVWDRRYMGPLLRFGGWMTITNIISPLMITADRFVIGAVISIAAVTYYSTPFEVVTKILLIPAALVGVMFPAFTSTLAYDQERATVLYARSVKYVFVALFPIVLCALVLAGNGLNVWLGGDFARHSTNVVRWLAGGVLANSLAMVPFAYVQGNGRPDLTGKLHLAELPIYGGLLFWLVRVDGIDGAAVAWAIRMGLDAIVLFVLARRLMPSRKLMRTRNAMLLAAGLFALALAPLTQSLASKAGYLLTVILGFVVVTWFVVLSPEERSIALRFWRGDAVGLTATR